MNAELMGDIFIILIYSGVLLLTLALGERIALFFYYRCPRFKRWFDKYSEQFDLEDNM